MELAKIKEKWTTTETYTPEKMEEYFKMYVEEKAKWNPLILAEECAELIQVLSKILRDKYDVANEDDRLSLIEEIADVEMLLRMIEIQFNIDIHEKSVNLTEFSNPTYNKTPNLEYLVIESLGRVIFDAMLIKRPDDFGPIKMGTTRVDIICLQANLNVLKHRYNISKEEMDLMKSIKFNRDIERSWIDKL